MSLSAATARRWTCPYCPLLCDSFGLQADEADGSWKLQGGHCSRAQARLADLPPPGAVGTPLVNGQVVDGPEAVAAAARALRDSRQPLFAGLGSDVAASRSLYRLAHDCAAICDAVNGQALFHGLRTLQDRGAYTCTLAEVRTRAEVIVCVGGSPAEQMPEFFRRCGLGENLVASRHVVFLGGADGGEDAAAPLAGLPGVTAEVLPLHGDLFDTVALLALAVAGRPAPAGLAALAQRLKASLYSVLAWEGSRLPAQGALVVEALNRIVASLNRSTRAATLPLGGGDGASTANEVQTWLSGLPLRSRVGAVGIEHEPLLFGTDRLLADGAVDLLLWLQAYNATALPPATPGLPRIVLGPPAMAARLPAQGDGLSIFIPVATPGIGSAGHAFRTDSVVLMPLHPVFDQGLPSAAEVVQQLHAAWKALP